MGGNADIAEIVGAHGDNACHMAAVAVGIGDIRTVIKRVIAADIALAPNSALKFFVRGIDTGIQHRNGDIFTP